MFRRPVAPGVALFPLRLFLGGTFLYAGVQKLSDPGYLTPGAATYIGTQLQQFAHGTPGGFILRALAIPHPVLAGVLAAMLELFVGLLVLAGWGTRAAAAAGLMFNLLLFLTNSWNTHPYFLGPDIVFVFGWLPLALAGAAGQPAVDTWLAERRAGGVVAGPARGSGEAGRRRGAPAPSLSRRTVLRAGLSLAAGATAALAGVSLLIRGLRPAATVGRTAQLGGGSKVAGAQAPATPATTPAGSASSPGASSTGLPAGAVRLGPSGRLAPGQAAVYRDPVDGSPDIVIRIGDGSLSALSAVCTHAGCECVYQPTGSGPELACPCHGSRFDARTGDVIQGPAIQPLPLREVVDHAGTLYAVPKRS